MALSMGLFINFSVPSYPWPVWLIKLRTGLLRMRERERERGGSENGEFHQENYAWKCVGFQNWDKQRQAVVVWEGVGNKKYALWKSKDQTWDRIYIWFEQNLKSILLYLVVSDQFSRLHFLQESQGWYNHDRGSVCQSLFSNDLSTLTKVTKRWHSWRYLKRQSQL